MFKKTLLWLGPTMVLIAWVIDLAKGHRDIPLAFAAGMCVMWLGLRYVTKRLEGHRSGGAPVYHPK